MGFRNVDHTLRPSLIRAVVAGCGLGVALPTVTLAQTDVERAGRELGGAKPPVQYYEFLARNPNAFRFSPDNGWIRRGRAIASQRSANRSLASVAPGVGGRAAVDPGGVLVGDLNMPVFLVLFANTDSAALVANLPRTTMQSRMFGTDPAPPYTVHSYYREISADRLRVNGTVLDWRRVSQNDSHYEGGCNGLCGAGDVEGLIAEMVQLHDPTVDYSQFDNDGADGVPNSGDDDGYVDAIVLFHPELDGACRIVNPSSASNIWAHKYYYSGWGVPDLETADPSASGGSVKIRDYIIQGGQGGDGGCTADAPQAMGVVAHETGHIFGLPDLYNTNQLRSSEGIGHWGLMGSGNWRIPTSPAHMEAWSRAELGWVTEVLVTSDTTVTLEPVALSDTALVVPIAGSDEYFLLENRQRLGSDAQSWGPGLLVWHVDSAAIAARRPSNSVNGFEPEGLVLEQADGREQLRLGASGGNRGDAGDPFPGSTIKAAFAHNTTPSTARNDSAPTFIIIDSIAQVVVDGAMRARIRFGTPSLIAATDTLARFRLDGAEFNRFLDVLEAGTDYQLEIDSVQVTSDGRTRHTWTGWSNGQSRAHMFTASAGGDTIIATVDTEFLLRVAVEGSGGAVTASPAVDVVTGEFVLRDEVVTLAGEATEPGKVFDGWGGDRTALTDTLVLTMDRPYNLTATFAEELLASAPELSPVVMGSQYRFTFSATGGNGTLSWQLASGTLPDGLSFLSTGVLTGRPSTLGDFSFVVQARSGSQVATVPVQLSVVAPAMVVDAVVRHLVGAGASLTSDEVTFLDLLGNRNARFDVGDFLAWVTTPGVNVAAELLARALSEEVGR